MGAKRKPNWFELPRRQPQTGIAHRISIRMENAISDNLGIRIAGTILTFVSLKPQIDRENMNIIQAGPSAIRPAGCCG